jgi:hypothetical protein
MTWGFANVYTTNGSCLSPTINNHWFVEKISQKWLAILITKIYSSMLAFWLQTWQIYEPSLKLPGVNMALNVSERAAKMTRWQRIVCPSHLRVASAKVSSPFDAAISSTKCFVSIISSPKTMLKSSLLNLSSLNYGPGDGSLKANSSRVRWGLRWDFGYLLPLHTLSGHTPPRVNIRSSVSGTVS